MMDPRILTPEEFEQQLLDGPPGSVALLLHNYRALAERLAAVERAATLAARALQNIQLGETGDATNNRYAEAERGLAALAERGITP